MELRRDRLCLACDLLGVMCNAPSNPPDPFFVRLMVSYLPFPPLGRPRSPHIILPIRSDAQVVLDAYLAFTVDTSTATDKMTCHVLLLLRISAPTFR